MEDVHRDIIQNNYKTLVDNVNIRELLPILIQKAVFSKSQAEAYQDPNKSEKEHKRQLFLDLPRRGPLAFENFVSSLKEVDKYHKKLANHLEGKDILETEIDENKFNEDKENENTFDTNDDICVEKRVQAVPFQLPEHQRPSHIRQISCEAPDVMINLMQEPLIVKVRKSEMFYDDRNKHKVPVYSMRSKHRGQFLCINNMEFQNNIMNYRKGADHDENNLKDLFKQMNFGVECHRNKTRRDMIQIIHSFTDAKCNPMLSKVDCVVVAIMSHGSEGETKESSRIATAEGQHLEVSWILEQFNNLNCKELINKPKIFIFQICRGNNLHVGVKLERRTQSDGENLIRGMKVRNLEDMLIAFATLPGDKSYRDIFVGAWFIRLVCKIFMEHAYDTDVENLLKIVDGQLRYIQSDCGNMQTSTYENRGFKICYLHPGL